MALYKPAGRVIGAIKVAQYVLLSHEDIHLLARTSSLCSVVYSGATSYAILRCEAAKLPLQFAETPVGN